MALFNLIFSPLALPATLLALLSLYLIPYFFTFSHLRRIPSPFPAQFTNFWLLYTCRRGKRYAYVDAVHARLGPVVRIQPNHISIADDAAIPLVYGHGNGFLKSNFYDAFVSIRRGLFNTRSRAEHTRKRKVISHTFAPKSVGQFEPYIMENLEVFTRKWDGIVERTGNHSNGWAQVECLEWFNFVAFDTIGDLAFGAPFGMLEAGADITEIRHSRDAAPIYSPAVEILNRRGEVSATLGIYPQLKAYAKWLPDPFFSNGLTAVHNLAGIAIARVTERLESPPDINRKDLLSRLQEGRDDKGEPLGFEELTAEALTQLIAGSDTTSNSSCALLYHVTRTPGVLPKLQAELDAAIPNDTKVPSYEMVRNLPYLEAVINETLRHHSTSGIGLPREIPPDSQGLHFRSHYFPPGTVLSVPTYTIHHSKEIWGPDADEFRPERWSTITERQKNAFIPFSYGPRSCVGRNVAEMEMKMIAATWAKRYDVELRQDLMETREGFLRKPLGLEIALKKREL
ncbi:cytochrome P450 [Pseudomassariella vexata]|uniref:Benzoate 4-monooxygenase bphA n=1 Tax=Pseudomassariella vexata TaxID=1141098 RepID=A0A1Y2DL71_9PEZI|nr:cytochrome P450 [Pseudomassariella vexata]ORY60003.1 cytochrome P450 [Pseudomassariella vexata]